jgi:hypothetical protein
MKTAIGFEVLSAVVLESPVFSNTRTMLCSRLDISQDRRLQWRPASHFIVYNVSKVSDYKLNRRSSIQYAKGPHSLRCDSFNWVKLSVLNPVLRYVMGSRLPPRHPQVFHNILVTIAMATLPFKLHVALWNKHEKEFEKIAHDTGLRTDMDSRPQTFIYIACRKSQLAG